MACLFDFTIFLHYWHAENFPLFSIYLKMLCFVVVFNLLQHVYVHSFIEVIERFINILFSVY